MQYFISLSVQQEHTLRQAYLTRPSDVRIPAHILLLLHQGFTAEKAAAITYVTAQEVDDAVRAFQVGGIAAILNGPSPEGVTCGLDRRRNPSEGRIA